MHMAIHILQKHKGNYLPVFETLEAVTVYLMIPSEPSELPSLRRVYSAIATIDHAIAIARTHAASTRGAAIVRGRKPDNEHAGPYT